MSAATDQAIEVAGMITLYNSQPTVIENVKRVIDQVACLYIVDNSEIVNWELVEDIKSVSGKIKYIGNGSNLGIARALNVAADAALTDGFSFLLLLDDDSQVPAHLVSQLMAVGTIFEHDNVGIIAAQSDPSVPNNDSIKEVFTIITSGSLLNLKTYKAVGPFWENLFIDWVDLEYCFRLRKYGYKILVHNGVRLTHRLGTSQVKRLFGVLPVHWRSHNPTRLYYKFRNSQYVMRQYRRQLPLTFVGSIYYELGRDVLKILFLETNKAIYLSSIRQALADSFEGRLGKINPKK